MSSKAPVERPELKPTTSSPTTSSDRVQYTGMSTSASPPMSPSAFSPTTPRAPSPSNRPSKSFSIPLPFQGRSLARASTTDSIFRSRSKSPRKPPPAAINTKSEGSTSQNPVRRMGSEPTISPTSPTHPVSPVRPTTIRKARKTSGTTTHYGRHSNEWLFGGISVRETMKGMWKDNDNQDN